MGVDHSNFVAGACPDALLVQSADGRIRYWNSAASAIFGYTTDEAVGRQLAELIVPTDRVDESRQQDAAAVDCGLVVYESVRRRRDGSLLHASISVKAVPDPEGAGTLLLSSVKDVTQLKAARDARLIDAKYRDMLESMPDAIVIVNATGRIVLVNTLAQHLFGYQRHEMVGQPVEMLLPARHHATHLEHRAGYVAQPRTRGMGGSKELFGRRKDGSEFPVEISLSPLRTEDGLVVSSAIRDATERRRVEESLQQANRMKSEFLANMSHELRTPLNAVIGFSELLVDDKAGKLNDMQREFVGDILVSGKHLLQLINDILDLSKVEAGRMQLFPEPFEVPRVVEEVCSVISQMAVKKSIALDYNCDTVGTVTLDRQRFKQVLLNLLSNAVKFTNDGGRVGIQVSTRDPRTLQVEVSDTGIGIPREHLSRLFVEFHQIDSSTARQHQGTGLGLALTRKLVELQRGAIEVQSEPGQGSVFTVFLPHETLAG